MKDNTYVFGTTPIDMSYIDPKLPIMTQFELRMNVPFRFFSCVNKDYLKELNKNPKKWIEDYFTEEEIIKYIKMAINQNVFKIKHIKSDYEI